MHFHPSIQETWMEPTTVLGTRNIKLPHTLHFPSLAVNEAELWVPSPSDDSYKTMQDFQWTELVKDDEEGTPERCVCVGDINIHRGSLLPALNDTPLFLFLFYYFLGIAWTLCHYHCLLFLNCFPSKSGCLLEFYKFFRSTKQAQSP